jgi:hypothetical protein
MKKATLALLVLLFTLPALQARAATNAPVELIPKGYVIFETIKGDLNNDGQEDYVFIVKATSRRAIIHDERMGRVDRNRRGIIVALKNGDHYDTALKNLHCFSSENEDGGVYFPPELMVSINKGNLRVHFGHGRYGYWSYRFRLHHSDFVLIGYDSSDDHGPVVNRFTSINLLTNKMLTRVNTNAQAQGGDERFKETWREITNPKPIYLSKIVKFEGFSVATRLGVPE